MKTFNAEDLCLVDVSRGGTVVAFGDSLTYGLYIPKIPRKDLQWHQYKHPYAKKLSQLLGNNTKVVEVGISGERTDQMAQRLPSALEQCPPPPNSCIVSILGGTNDLGYRVDPEQIVVNLKALHQIALDASNFVFTIAITIPQSAFALNLNERFKVNEEIRKFAKSCSKRIALLDLESQFDLRHESENSKYWSRDKLHFSPLGYDTFGQLLFSVMYDYKVSLPDDAEDVDKDFFCQL